MDSIFIYRSKMKNKHVRVFHQTPAQAKAYVTSLLLDAAKRFIPPATNPKRYEERKITVIIECEDGFKKKLSINTYYTHCRGTLRKWILEKVNHNRQTNKIIDIIFIN